MISPQEFIDTLFSDIDPDEVICVSEGRPMREDPKQMWFNNTSTGSRLWKRWKPESDPRAMYYSVCTVTGAENDKGRLLRGRSNLMRPHVLVLDDIGQKTTEPPVAPTYILETSPGSFQWGYALLDTTVGDLQRFETLVKAIHGLGYGDAGAGGSYRVVRVPGSANLKPGRDGFRARLTSWTPEWAWQLDGLAYDFGLDLDNLPVVDTSAPRSELAGGAAAEGDDVLLQWLVTEGHVVADHGGDFIDIVCPWADRHTGGANTAGYSPLGRGRDGWERVRGFRCLHEHCSHRSIRDLWTWSCLGLLGSEVSAQMDEAVARNRRWRETTRRMAEQKLTRGEE